MKLIDEYLFEFGFIGFPSIFILGLGVRDEDVLWVDVELGCSFGLIIIGIY